MAVLVFMLISNSLGGVAKHNIAFWLKSFPMTDFLILRIIVSHRTQRSLRNPRTIFLADSSNLALCIIINWVLNDMLVH